MKKMIFALAISITAISCAAQTDSNLTESNESGVRVEMKCGVGVSDKLSENMFISDSAMDEVVAKLNTQDTQIFEKSLQYKDLDLSYTAKYTPKYDSIEIALFEGGRELARSTGLLLPGSKYLATHHQIVRVQVKQGQFEMSAGCYPL